MLMEFQSMDEYRCKNSENGQVVGNALMSGSLQLRDNIQTRRLCYTPLSLGLKGQKEVKMAEDRKRIILWMLSFAVMVTLLLWLNALLVPCVKDFFTCQNKTAVYSGIQQQLRKSKTPKLHLLDKMENIRILSKVEVNRHEWKMKDVVDKHKLNKNQAQCANMRNEDKFDCHRQKEVLSNETCTNRGCCWKPVMAKKKIHGVLAPLDVPWCYYPQDYPGYKMYQIYNTNLGFNAGLSRTTQSLYPETIMDLIMEVRYETNSRLRIKIYDPNNSRYEVPISTPKVSKAADNTMYTVNISPATENFYFSVSRKDTSTHLLNTKGASPLTFCNQFIEISSFLPSKYIYGLGEHRDRLLHSMNWTRFTMWNRDRPPKENMDLYGTHPFYLMMENDGKSHGVFLLNSNAMDVILQPAPAITWRTIGGIIDMYVFMGPSPAEVIQQYTEVIGHSFMPPYWSLGFHNCRWGYKTANETLEIVHKLRQAGMPQDVQWNDMDYMDGRKDFTIGDYFGDMSGMVDTIHQAGLHYIMIVDPSMSIRFPGKYPPYDIGMKMDIFIKDAQGKPLVGVAWAGNTTFPDFTNRKTTDYWTELVQKFHDKVQFDGMWIDENEISNAGTAGSVNGCPNNTIENPPYVPAVVGGTLRAGSICNTAIQNASIAYNVHNLYGLTEAAATYAALKTVRKKRPFSISRSTYAGHGQYGGHWSGDNSATYHDMTMSLPEVLNFNMFGISMVGPDICGFFLDVSEELCQRWYQIGAFYPFSRSHNYVNAKSHEPTAFSQSMIDSTKKAYNIRYTLLPHLYTLFHKSHIMGHTVARPLFFEFPTDKQTYSIDTQFLLGSSLLISPVLAKNITSVDAYFPSGIWYDWYTGEEAIRSSGATMKIDAPLSKINVHTRGGSILPMQEPELTSTASRKNDFGLIVSLDVNKTAEGELFWDDGDTIGTYTMRKYNMFKFSCSMNKLTSNIMFAGYTDHPMILGKIVIFGLYNEPTSVEMNGMSVAFTFDSNKVLRAEKLSTDMFKPFQFEWK